MSENAVYRALQQHLDHQAVGFPATKSAAELRFLEQLFTPNEARLAQHLTYRPSPLERIMQTASPEFSEEQACSLLESMATKGAIGWKEKDGAGHWFLLPMVVGMYESQDGNINPQLQAEAEAYMSSQEYGVSLLAAAPSQMRTIPVGIDVPVRNYIATYDQIRAIVENARGPFVVLPCICRESAASKGRHCERTSRTETCLGFGDAAMMTLRRMHGREITREEVISILRENEKDGLVLQPSNARNPTFVCSCCGCCCGMLGMQKHLPHPLNFWATNFFAAVDTEACKGCGKCVERCHVNGMALRGSPKKAAVDLNRCIGCGVCATTCPSHAIRLEKRAADTVPPADEEELYNQIHTGRKGWPETRRAVMRLIRDEGRYVRGS
jgi:H+/Na+-translocating ferredoxin:NAD+ oxidoreductase subunit B